MRLPVHILLGRGQKETNAATRVSLFSCLLLNPVQGTSPRDGATQSEKGLSHPVSSVWKCCHRHALRFESLVFANSIKLLMKIISCPP